jgi:AcrR family transcriptional regulator
MRVRTADRRQAIIDAAMQVFREVGYERASMAMISARVGGSKATLYGYFASKEELFAAAMIAEMDDRAQKAIALLDAANPDVAQVFRRFATDYIAVITSADGLSLIRTAIAEGVSSGLGARLYEMGPERAWRDMANYIARLQEKGLIRPIDPRVAAAHLKGLIEAGILEPLLFGARAWFSAEEAVDHAVEAFLTAYGNHQRA